MSQKLDMKTKRELAKIGMTAGLGIAVATAPFLKRSRTIKNLHTGAGLILTGFAIWHQSLYRPAGKKQKKKLPSPENG